jgi:hypothetical protein
LTRRRSGGVGFRLGASTLVARLQDRFGQGCFVECLFGRALGDGFGRGVTDHGAIGVAEQFEPTGPKFGRKMTSQISSRAWRSGMSGWLWRLTPTGLLRADCHRTALSQLRMDELAELLAAQ